MNKIFNNPKTTVAIIILVILMFVAYKQAEATEIEGGLTYASEFNGGYSLTVMERVLDNKIDLGVTLISEQDYAKENLKLKNNGNVWASFIATKPENWTPLMPTEVSIGAAYWIETSRFIGCRLGYQLGIKYRFGDASIGVRHWSNAGSCRPNRGQDLLTIGWRF